MTWHAAHLCIEHQHSAVYLKFRQVARLIYILLRQQQDDQRGPSHQRAKADCCL
eukprot:COSAG06_NODE_48382_length_332_cov_1.085837_1_plen_53_part_01